MQNLIERAFQNKESFVMYRLPESDVICMIAGPTQQIKGTQGISKLEHGFLIQPFDPSSDALFIKANQVSELKEAEFLSESISVDRNQFYSKSHNDSNTTQNAYQQLVEESVELIQEKEYKKLVCAHIEKLDDQKTNPIVLFKELCKQYKTGFISLQSTPEFGTWIGNSPEILLEVDNNDLHTVALAGTQLRTDESHPGNAVWTQKEIEEQALVSRYIINCFKSIRLREFEEEGPRTIEAGNLMHLKSDYHVNMLDTDIQNLPSVLLPLLHPTSAVCGMPKEKSMRFLLEKEEFDRALYAGYLGPIDGEQTMHLFVNLRCMQLTHNEVIYYAGAGITGSSNSEKEWVETQNKKAGLKNIVDSI